MFKGIFPKNTISISIKKELLTSIIQGLVIATATLLIYQIAVGQNLDESTTRTMIFTTLLSANIMLTLVNRSFNESFITSMKNKNRMVTLIIAITIVLSFLMLYVSPITQFFEFKRLHFNQLVLAAGMGISCVIWYELVKWFKRRKVGG